MAWGGRRASQESFDHTCPRCNYDQRGEISRWSESCPTRGICSECGLEFDWADVLMPRRNMLPDFVEHERWKRVVPASWRTGWWALFARRFWTIVRLEHRPRISRMLVWIALLILVPRVLSACLAALVLTSGGVRTWPPGTSLPLLDRLGQVLLDGITAVEMRSGPVTVLTLPAGIVVFVTAALTLPAVLACLPWTRARAKVHGGHVSRATVYSLVPLAALQSAWVLALLVWCAHKLLRPSPRGFPIFNYSYWQYLNFGERAKVVGEWAWIWGGWIAAAWLIYWWWNALSRGFRIRGSGMVVAALVVCGGLACLVCLAFTHPMLMVSIFGER